MGVVLQLYPTKFKCTNVYSMGFLVWYMKICTNENFSPYSINSCSKYFIRTVIRGVPRILYRGFLLVACKVHTQKFCDHTHFFDHAYSLTIAISVVNGKELLVSWQFWHRKTSKNTRRTARLSLKRVLYLYWIWQPGGGFLAKKFNIESGSQGGFPGNQETTKVRPWL